MSEVTAAKRTVRTTHTPGPWKQNTLVVQDAHAQTIAHCARWELGTPKPEVAEANARLIAAAPDLLDAARDILRFVEAQPDSLQHAWFPVIENLRDAIKRAEGA